MIHEMIHEVIHEVIHEMIHEMIHLSCYVPVQQTIIYPACSMFVDVYAHVVITFSRLGSTTCGRIPFLPSAEQGKTKFLSCFAPQKLVSRVTFGSSLSRQSTKFFLTTSVHQVLHTHARSWDYLRQPTPPPPSRVSITFPK